MTIQKSLIHEFIYLSAVYIYMSTRKEEIKSNKNIDENKPTYYDKNTNFNKDGNNFNEITNNTINQQQRQERSCLCC